MEQVKSMEGGGGQDRLEQDKAGWNRAGPREAEKVRMNQDSVGWRKSRQGGTGQGRVE